MGRSTNLKERIIIPEPNLGRTVRLLLYFHLHKFHDKQESIFLQKNILEVDQVWVD